MGFSFMYRLRCFSPSLLGLQNTSEAVPAASFTHFSLLSPLLLLPINMTQLAQMCFKGKGTSVLL